MTGAYFDNSAINLDSAAALLHSSFPFQFINVDLLKRAQSILVCNLSQLIGFNFLLAEPNCPMRYKMITLQEYEYDSSLFVISRLNSG